MFYVIMNLIIIRRLLTYENGTHLCSSRRDFPDSKFTLVYLTLPGDEYELELTYNYDHAAYDLGDGYGHIAISSDDLEKLHEEHKNKGFNVTDLKGLPGTDPSYYFITDPDGYKIEVIR